MGVKSVYSNSKKVFELVYNKNISLAVLYLLDKDDINLPVNFNFSFVMVLTLLISYISVDNALYEE